MQEVFARTVEEWKSGIQTPVMSRHFLRNCLKKPTRFTGWKAPRLFLSKAVQRSCSTVGQLKESMLPFGSILWRPASGPISGIWLKQGLYPRPRAIVWTYKVFCEYWPIKFNWSKIRNLLNVLNPNLHPDGFFHYTLMVTNAHGPSRKPTHAGFQHTVLQP